MVTLAAFNAAPAGEAERCLRGACDSAAFTTAMLASRPYPDETALLAAADTATEALTWDDVLEAMAAHPRIGDRVSGHSAAEQAGVNAADRDALAAANAAYEARFGHVYLVCATGLTGRDMLADVRRRLANDDQTERRVAQRELMNITRLRLSRLLRP